MTREGEPGGDTGFCSRRPPLWNFDPPPQLGDPTSSRPQRSLSWMVGGPAVAVGELVPPDLPLDRRGHWSADPRDHQKAVIAIDLGAAERPILRHDAVHRVAIMLDLRHAALPDAEPASVSMIIDRGWRNNGMDCGLRSIHDHALRLFEFGREDTRFGTNTWHSLICIHFSPPSGGAAISAACARLNRCRAVWSQPRHLSPHFSSKPRASSTTMARLYGPTDHGLRQ